MLSFGKLLAQTVNCARCFKGRVHPRHCVVRSDGSPPSFVCVCVCCGTGQLCQRWDERPGRQQIYRVPGSAAKHNVRLLVSHAAFTPRITRQRCPGESALWSWIRCSLTPWSSRPDHNRRMIWEQGVECIVMTTGLTEGGRKKCHRYWPEDAAEPYEFGWCKVGPPSLPPA